MSRRSCQVLSGGRTDSLHDVPKSPPPMMAAAHQSGRVGRAQDGGSVECGSLRRIRSAALRSERESRSLYRASVSPSVARRGRQASAPWKSCPSMIQARPLAVCVDFAERGRAPPDRRCDVGLLIPVERSLGTLRPHAPTRSRSISNEFCSSEEGLPVAALSGPITLPVVASTAKHEVTDSPPKTARARRYRIRGRRRAGVCRLLRLRLASRRAPLRPTRVPPGGARSPARRAGRGPVRAPRPARRRPGPPGACRRAAW